MNDHGLGRVASPPDERDNRYLARRAFGPLAEPVRRHRKWYTQHTRHFDQGPIGQCTMYSAAHIVAAGPVTQRPYTYLGGVPPFDTIAGYCRAQEIDKAAHGWGDPTFCQDYRRPGGRGDWGATMRSAAQVLRELRYIDRFWWFTTVHEMAVYVSNIGPAWIGSNWFSGMNEPDGDGFIWPTGRSLGGHAYVVDEVVWERRGDRVKYFWMLNSWWPWGRLNRAKITEEAMGELLRDNGEALAVTELRRSDP